MCVSFLCQNNFSNLTHEFQFWSCLTWLYLKGCLTVEARDFFCKLHTEFGPIGQISNLVFLKTKSMDYQYPNHLGYLLPVQILITPYTSYHILWEGSAFQHAPEELLMHTMMGNSGLYKGTVRFNTKEQLLVTMPQVGIIWKCSSRGWMIAGQNCYRGVQNFVGGWILCDSCLSWRLSFLFFPPIRITNF